MNDIPDFEEVRKYMNRALSLAEKAAENGEIPVGCVVVRDGRIVGEGSNESEKTRNALKHAEMIALSQAMERLSSRVLTDCDIYVTLEPCPMCAGAIKNAGCRRVFFGAYDEDNGACLSKWNILGNSSAVYGGIEREACTEIITKFFTGIRKKITASE